MKIYTKSGDAGETGLFYGGRVPKNDPRCEAYGQTDHAVCAMGLARSLCSDEKVKKILLEVQNHMFTVGAELAVAEEHYENLKRTYNTVSPDMVIKLESFIDELSWEVELPPNFILPGSSSGSASLDLARASIRTAERRIIGLDELGMLNNKTIISYINRLSDLLFMLARYEDKYLPVEVITGQKLDE